MGDAFKVAPPGRVLVVLAQTKKDNTETGHKLRRNVEEASVGKLKPLG
jgi:hypothetical protein